MGRGAGAGEESATEEAPAMETKLMFVPRRFRVVGAAAALISIASVPACSFEVSNPGPVQDENINLPGAHQGLVNGAVRSFGDGLGGMYIGDGIVGGHMPSGHTGTAGTQAEEEVALLHDERTGDRGAWGTLQRGRWIGEEAIRRFDEHVPNADSYPLKVEAHFWAGMASRVLGENMCTAVFDGGPAEPRSAYFERAIEHFNRAEALAASLGMSDIAMAAVGARAAANLFLGRGSAARTDAAKVPFNFKFTTRYTGFSADPNYYFAEGVASPAFQSVSLWGTPAHAHFMLTGDSRVAWGYDNGSKEIPAGQEFATRGQNHPSRPTWNALVPMYYPLKLYAPRRPTRELQIFEPNVADQRQIQINLVTGREMELVLAEVALMEGDWQSAMTHINNVRTATPVYQADLSTVMDLRLHPNEQRDKLRENLPDYFTGTPGNFAAGGMMAPVTANSLEEAWAALKFERYLELHLEMRRFGDRWRWRENGTPGALHPLEFIPDKLAQKYGVPTDPLNLCFPTPRSEKNSNPNVPLTFQDWRAP